jgi:uncharacterized protein
MKRRDCFRAAAAAFLGSTVSVVPSKGARAMQRHEENSVRVIDAYSHCSTVSFIEKLEKLGGAGPNPFRAIFENNRPLLDPLERIRLMDRDGVDCSIMVPMPYIESSPAVHADPAKALEAARFINDAVAETAARNSKRLTGAALIPTTNSDIMLQEFERAIKELHMVGGYFAVSPAMKAPDHSDFIQLYKKAAELNVPLWIHPARSAQFADYAGETASKHNLWITLGWPMDSSTAMVRIALSGIFDTLPNLKLIIHHRGALIPEWSGRIVGILERYEKLGMPGPNITKPYMKHFKKFYCDTAVSGHEPQLLKAAHDFFGPDQMVFGTDWPLGDEVANSRASVNASGMSREEMKKVYSGNILRIIPSRGYLTYFHE